MFLTEKIDFQELLIVRKTSFVQDPLIIKNLWQAKNLTGVNGQNLQSERRFFQKRSKLMEKTGFIKNNIFHFTVSEKECAADIFPRELQNLDFEEDKEIKCIGFFYIWRICRSENGIDQACFFFSRSKRNHEKCMLLKNSRRGPETRLGIIAWW